MERQRERDRVALTCSPQQAVLMNSAHLSLQGCHVCTVKQDLQIQIQKAILESQPASECMGSLCSKLLMNCAVTHAAQSRNCEGMVQYHLRHAQPVPDKAGLAVASCLVPSMLVTGS